MNILYLHGFGSSGQSNTVEYLKKSLPDYYDITAPDIPVDPAEALPFLKQLCEEEHFSVIIGTSMGGMYAHQLPADFVRICVNPALHLSEITDVMKVGTFDFFQPRKDGQTQYTITEEIIRHYREMEAHQFDLSGGEIDNIVRKSFMEEVLTGNRPTLEMLEAWCKGEKLHAGKAAAIGFNK